MLFLVKVWVSWVGRAEPADAAFGGRGSMVEAHDQRVGRVELIIDARVDLPLQVRRQHRLVNRARSRLAAFRYCPTDQRVFVDVALGEIEEERRSLVDRAAHVGLDQFVGYIPAASVVSNGLRLSKILLP